MAIFSKYLATFMENLTVSLRSGSNIQTVAIAIAISGSLLCSLLLLLANLISRNSKGTHQVAGASSKFDGRKPYKRNHSGSYLRGVPTTTRSHTHAPSSAGRDGLRSNAACLRCQTAESDKQCQRRLCRLCCHCNGQMCVYHGYKTLSYTQQSMTEHMNLSNQGLTSCPERIGYSGPHVRTLLLANNRLSELPEEIGCLQGLTHLDLSNNRLSSLPDCLGNLSALKDLRLGNNQLTVIPDRCARLRMLEDLQLQNNQLEIFPAIVCKLGRLKRVVISHNKLETLPADFCKLTNLCELDVSHNPLTSLPKSIDNLVLLQDINASNCQLSSLPAAISSCVCLTNLDVSHNRLTELPPGTGRLHRLQELRVENNHLQYLPMSLFMFMKQQDLKIFTAHGNCFIPKEHQGIFLSKNSPLLSSHITTKDQTCIPTLRENCAKSVINNDIDWKKENLPAVIKDMLERVRHCHQCDVPMFESYHSRLEFGAFASWPCLPFYEHKCDLHSGNSTTHSRVLR